MMKDMLHKKKLSNKIQKGNTNTQKKIVVNFFYFIFFFFCCVFVICCSRVRVDFQVLYPPLLGVPNKWLPRAKRPIMISYTQFSKTLLPLILYIQSIQYMVEFLPYIFSQCLYTLATFDVGWAAAVAKPKPHPPSITLLYVLYVRLYQQLNSTEKREVVPSKKGGDRIMS